MAAERGGSGGAASANGRDRSGEAEAAQPDRLKRLLAGGDGAVAASSPSPPLLLREPVMAKSRGGEAAGGAASVSADGMAAPPDAASEAAELDAKLRRDSDSRSSVGGSSSGGGDRRVDKFGFLVAEDDAPAREALTFGISSRMEEVEPNLGSSWVSNSREVVTSDKEAP
uniref:Uncharacterized protein n=1 Tax=Sphaerodactylus townsendi TaxID=933632 RepID=A0ACB8FYY5_9SAUR